MLPSVIGGSGCFTRLQHSHVRFSAYSAFSAYSLILGGSGGTSGSARTSGSQPSCRTALPSAWAAQRDAWFHSITSSARASRVATASTLRMRHQCAGVPVMCPRYAITASISASERLAVLKPAICIRGQLRTAAGSRISALRPALVK
jgi:hypothetical protein